MALFHSQMQRCMIKRILQQLTHIQPLCEDVYVTMADFLSFASIEKFKAAGSRNLDLLVFRLKDINQHTVKPWFQEPGLIRV